MNQQQLFDSEMSDKLKADGMARAEDNAKSALEIAREVAVEIGRTRRFVDADDVGKVLKERNDIDTLGPAAGSLFRQKCWRFTGRWRKARRISSHSRMIRVWEYVGG